jgi:hypothetical protein
MAQSAKTRSVPSEMIRDESGMKDDQRRELDVAGLDRLETVDLDSFQHVLNTIAPATGRAYSKNTWLETGTTRLLELGGACGDRLTAAFSIIPVGMFRQAQVFPREIVKPPP